MTASVRTAEPAALAGVDGLRWLPNSQVVLSGPPYRLFTACDAAFVALADTWGAAAEEHPAVIDANALRAAGRLDPHRATYAVSPDVDGDPSGFREILTPAACHHVYPHHRGEQLPAATYVTTRNTCFRRAERYEPLRRQWSFRMREIVCLGTREEVTGFLLRTRVLVDALLRELGLPVEWVTAPDPWAIRHEARFGEDLAIASVNLHEDRFGEAFGIGRAGRPAVTGCVAFGLERWLYAILERHGTRPAGWPDVVAAARRALASVAALAAGAGLAGTA